MRRTPNVSDADACIRIADAKSYVAETLFPTEWGAAYGKDMRHALRQRAERILLEIRDCSLNEGNQSAAPSAKPDMVRIATKTDTASLLELIRSSEIERLNIGDRDYERVRCVVELAVDRSPIQDSDGMPVHRPVFGVIGTDIVEAACGLYPVQPWDSEALYLRGFYFFVNEPYRKQMHGKHLLQFGNWFSEKSSMPLVWEVPNARRFDQRDRLFSRQTASVGGLFMHQPASEAIAA